MLRIAFIISLWPALLSAAGLGGQLYFAMRPVPAPVAIVLSQPETTVSALAFGVFLLPIIVSLLLVTFHVRRTKTYGGYFIATLALNTFSLLYGFILFSALR